MPGAYPSSRIETLLALSLSQRWRVIDTRSDSGETLEGDNTDGRKELDEKVSAPELTGELPLALQGLSAPDREAVEALLRRYARLSPADRTRWLDQRLDRIRATTPERNRRIEKSIHPSQIIDALRVEPTRIQSLIIGLLPEPQAAAVAEALGVPGAENLAMPPSKAIPTKVAEVVCRAFFAQFVSVSSLNSPTELDMLSGVELARLIRLLGVRETAIACQGIAAVETVTAFLKRFSAEDAHAIVSHFAALKAVEPERIQFAEQMARRAISEEADVASTMLDRVGLSLLAIVLEGFGTLRRRQTAQKLPLAASRELEDLLGSNRTYCDREMSRRIVAEAQSLAASLHRLTLEAVKERRAARA